MKCPLCGDYGYVRKTRGVEDIVLRRRRCPAGHEFWTHETIYLNKGTNSALTGNDIVTLLRSERGSG